MRRRGDRLERIPTLISKNIIRRNYKNEKLSTSLHRPSGWKKKLRRSGARRQRRVSKSSSVKSNRPRRRSTCRLS